jgi:predicted  nucleic acid-binding Zn-ribbon protein
MAQDDRKGKASEPGKAPAPTAPDTPDTREIQAPPPPEEPLVQPSPPEPPAPPAPPAAGGSDAGAAGNDGESESDRLRREIDEAEKALHAKKADLARAEERRKAEEATVKMVQDYAREIPALTAREDGLRQYRLAQTSFLGKFLDAATIQKIPNVAVAPQQEIDALAAKIDGDAQTVEKKKGNLAATKAAAAAAKAQVEALKRPAAPIQNRLKAAEAIGSDAKKAADAGNYALAYWLIMDGGRLDEWVHAEPRIIPASDLEAAVRQAAADQARAEQNAAALQSEIGALDASLQADRARLAALRTSLEATIRDRLAALNPKPAEAA